MRHTSPMFVSFLVCGLLAIGPAAMGQPPSLPGGGGGAKPAVVGELEAKIKALLEESVGSLSFLPDDVLGAVFKCAQHPENIVTEQAHATDKEFNEAASLLYTQYPDIYKMMQDNPLTTAMVGQQAKNNPTQTWGIIDSVREKNALAPPGGTESPKVKVDTSGLEKSMGTASDSMNTATKSLNSTTSEINDLNENLDEINDEIDEANAKADEAEAKVNEAESYAKNPGSSKELTTTAGVAALASGGQGGGAASPFGPAGGGKGMSTGFGMMPAGRGGAGGKGWTSGSVSPGMMQDGGMGASKSFGASEMVLQRQGAIGGGMKPGGGGMQPGGPGRR